MKQIILVFTDAAHADEVLAALSLLARDDVGLVQAPTGNTVTVEGQQVPEMAPVPGWHVVAVVEDGPLAPELVPHRVVPAYPVRRFAGIEDWAPPAPPPTPTQAPVPAEVTMRQARLALLGAGLLAQVNAAIAAMPGPQGEAARIEWEFSSTVRRQQPLVLALAPALGMTPAQLDDLFRVAVTL